MVSISEESDCNYSKESTVPISLLGGRRTFILLTWKMSERWNIHFLLFFSFFKPLKPLHSSSFFLTSPFTWFSTQEHRENGAGSLVQKPLLKLMVFLTQFTSTLPTITNSEQPSILSKIKPNPPLSHHDDDDQFLAEVPPEVDEDTWTEVLNGFAHKVEEKTRPYLTPSLTDTLLDTDFFQEDIQHYSGYLFFLSLFCFSASLIVASNVHFLFFHFLFSSLLFFLKKRRRRTLQPFGEPW